MSEEEHLRITSHLTNVRFWCTRCNDQIDATVDGACSCAGVVVKDGVVRVVYTPAPFGIEPPPGLMWEE
jgi:hypothetical protein